MKKVLFLMLTLVTLGFAATPVSAQTVWDGTVDISWYDVSQTSFDISTPEQLAGVASLVNSGTSFNGVTLNLLNDLWLNADNDSTNNWVPIGGSATATGEEQSSGNAFKGNFNGHGYKIYNLYCDKTNYFHAGLFGCIQNPCTIDSLVLVNPTVKSCGMMGAIAGMSRSGGTIYIRYCLVINANIVGTPSGIGPSASHNNIGGILGANYPNSSGTYIENCGVTGSVSGYYIGGIGGNSQYDYLTNCYFAGSLTPYNSNYGGMNAYSGSRTNCYSYVTVTNSQSQSSDASNGTSVTQAEMQSDNMITLLGDAFKVDNGINSGYPIMSYMAGVSPVTVEICAGESVTLTAFGYDSYLWDNGATTESITVTPTATTTYTMTGTANGISFTHTSTVTVYPQAVITASVVAGSDGQVHGTVTPETSTVACGSSDNVTLMVTPDEDYRVELVTLNGTVVYGDEFGPGVQYITVNPGGTLATVKIYLSKCAILSLPFTDGFETYATQQVAECYGKISSSVYPYAANSSNSHSGANCLYTYLTSTSDSYIAVLPKIFDLNAYPMSSLMISFWGKTTSSSNSITVGVMSDPTNAATFIPIETHVPSAASVQELFTTYFGPLADGNPYIALRMNCGSTYTYTYVDDIVVDVAPTCSPVTHLTVDNIYGTNASLHWDANVIGETLDYLITVTETATQVSTTYTTTETDYILSGLNEQTAYTVAVQPNCSGGDYGSEVTVSFTTPCVAPIAAVNNSYPTSTYSTEGNHFPMSNHYLNSFTEQIYFPSDFNNVSAEFSGMSFQYNDASEITRTLDIYMAHTADSVFVQNVWATPVDNYVHVYSGLVVFNRNGTDRWVDIAFDTNFYYNGYDNLLLVVNDITGSEVNNSNAKFYTVNTNTDRSQCEYSHDAGANWSITNMPATGRLHTQVDNIRLTACDVVSCIAPNTLTLGVVDANSAEISWFNPNASQSCEIEYQSDADADWISMGSFNGSSYTLYGLDANTHYQVRVRAICGSSSESTWSETIDFRTECDAIVELPYSQNFDSDTYGSGTEAYVYCWDRYSTDASKPVQLYPTSAAHTTPNALRFYDGAGVTNIAIMPKVDESISLNTLEVSFWVRSTSSSAPVILELGVMTDKNDPTSFEILDTIPAPYLPDNQYTLVEYSLENYMGYGQYIAFRASNGNGGNNLRLDDVTLDYIPVCVHPTNLTVDAVTSETVTVHWTEAGNAGTWHVEYGLAGFESGEGTVETAYDTTYTVYGLTPNTEYDLYVWADCGGLESTSINASFRTDCGPIVELPYTENFETGIYSTSQDNYILCWSRYASDPAHYMYVPSNSYAHSGTHFLDSHWTTGCYNIAIAPELDQSIDVSQLMVNFWACRTGSSGTLEVGVMDDPDVDSTFVPIDTIDLSYMNTYAYDEKYVKFNNYTGTGKYIAFRVSNAASCGYYIDDVTIDYAPSCSPVSNVEASEVTGTSAVISWNPGFFGTVASYTLEYSEGGQDAWITVDNIDTNYYLLGNLNFSTYYDIRVKTNCDDESSSDWAMMTFHTNCLVGGDVAIGDGTATNSYLPSYSYYSYSYTQQLFLAEEMGGMPRSLESVTFDMANYSVNRTYMIYLMHTSETSSSSWIDASGAQLVFDAPQQLHAGLNTFQFSTPFEYNGTDNLLLIVLDMTGSWTSGNNWRTHSAFSNASRYIYQDGSAYSTSSVPSSSGTGTSARNNVIFGSPCDTTTTCVAPHLNITAITSDGATVNWVAGYQESAWEIEYRPVDDTNWISLGTVTSMSEVITGLAPNTAYKVRMRSDCGGEYSYWTEESFTTACGAFTAPWFEDFEGYTSAQLVCWETPVMYVNGSNFYPYVLRNYGEAAHSGGNTAEFKGYTNMLVLPEFTNDIHTLRMSFWATYFGSSASAVVGVITDVNDTTTFEPLFDAGTPGPRGSSAGGNGAYMGPFDFNNAQATSGRIAILYTGPNTSSGWNMDDFTVELIPSCAAPNHTSVVVDNVTAYTADVSFTDNEAGHSSWVIYYGETGTSTGTWNNLNVTATSGNTLTGLTPNTSYSVYVKTICNGVEGDDQTATVTFTTQPSCPVPTGLSVSGILSSTADVYWAPGANETEWELEYGFENFTLGSGTNVTVNGTAYYQLQNLLPNTKYDVYVRAICSATDNSEWTSKVDFRTACDAYQLPLTENFDSYADWYSPDCWKKFESPDITGYAYIYGTYSYSGNKSLKVGTNASTSYYGYIRLPLLDAPSLNPLQISFKGMRSYGSTRPLQICVSTEFGSIDNLTVVASIDTLTSTWTDVTVPFDTYTGTGMYIVIGVPTGYSESCTYWIDDVVVDYADTIGPVLTDPTVATEAATYIAQTEATLNGTIMNPDNVTITTKGFEWKATVGGTYTPVVVTSSALTHNLTGLTANTDYTYKAFITFNGTTVYGDEMTFTTLPEDTPVPCDAPTNLHESGLIIDKALGVIDVVWEDQGGASQWNLQYRLESESDWNTVTVYETHCMLENLEGGAVYVLRVQAVCDNGTLSEWSDILTAVAQSVGIDNYLDNSVTLYPNPANDVVNVQCAMNNVQLEGIEVIDVYGKVVRTVVGANNYSPMQTRINVSDLANGMYFVRVTTEMGIVTKQFVKR